MIDIVLTASRGTMLTEKQSKQELLAEPTVAVSSADRALSCAPGLRNVLTLEHRF